MEYLLTAWNFLLAHKAEVAIVLYILLNIAPRIPEPQDKAGWKHKVWAAFEALMVLPWDRWLGLPKTISWQPLDGKVVLPDTPVVRQLAGVDGNATIQPLDRDTDKTGT